MRVCACVYTCVCVCTRVCVCTHSHERGVVSSLGPRAPLERSTHTLKF